MRHLKKIKMEMSNIIIPNEIIQDKIYLIRNQKVMLDSDLAILYQVETKRINEQVKRNLSKFPKHFMFQLDINEYENLKSQNATSSFLLETYHGETQNHSQS